MSAKEAAALIVKLLSDARAAGCNTVPYQLAVAMACAALLNGEDGDGDG